MTDALSALGRDAQRATAFEEYLYAICDWAEGGYATDARDKVREAANDHDMIRGGFWGSGSAIATRIEQRLDALQSADKVTWGRLLAQAEDVFQFDLKTRLQAASPFGTEMISFISYGMGFTKQPEGALPEMIADRIRAAGFTVHNGETYLVSLPEDAFDRMGVVQLHAGY